MQDETKLQQFEAKCRSLVFLVDKLMRRWWAAAEARAYGWGGVCVLSGMIGMSQNTMRLAMELAQQGHAVSLRTVDRLLNADGYSLQSNRKTKAGEDHPDRNAQFKHINAIVRRFHRRGQPVVSVDAKK